MPILDAKRLIALRDQLNDPAWVNYWHSSGGGPILEEILSYQIRELLDTLEDAIPAATAGSFVYIPEALAEAVTSAFSTKSGCYWHAQVEAKESGYIWHFISSHLVISCEVERFTRYGIPEVPIDFGSFVVRGSDIAKTVEVDITSLVPSFHRSDFLATDNISYFMNTVPAFPKDTAISDEREEYERQKSIVPQWVELGWHTSTTNTTPTVSIGGAALQPIHKFCASLAKGVHYILGPYTTARMNNTSEQDVLVQKLQTSGGFDYNVTFLFPFQSESTDAQ